MKRLAIYLGIVLTLLVLGLTLWTAEKVRASSDPAGGSLRSNWSATAAASYLDSREEWWQSWPVSRRGEGTVCISCHTVLPYAFSRPALRNQLDQTELSANERIMLSSIEKRVTDWQRIDHYYSDKAHYATSRATESVLNAVILTEYDSRSADLSPLTRKAFDEAWALQLTAGQNAGGWEWQDFHEAPWESSESAYQGAAMMAIAVGLTPQEYSDEPATREHVVQLGQYLVRNYPAQPLLNQLYVLWASARFQGLLTAPQQARLIHELANLQNTDGGWSLEVLDKQHSFKHVALDLFKRADGVDGSDGYATGLVVLALEEKGVTVANPMLQKGLSWLKRHQYVDGSWWASSMNGFRDPGSDMGRFMSDAATGYAALAIARSTSGQPVRIETTASGAGKSN